MCKNNNEYLGWTICIEEVSACVYKVVCKDKNNRVVENKGTDPEMLVNECKKTIENIQNRNFK